MSAPQGHLESRSQGWKSPCHPVPWATPDEGRELLHLTDRKAKACQASSLCLKSATLSLCCYTSELFQEEGILIERGL